MANLWHFLSRCRKPKSVSLSRDTPEPDLTHRRDRISHGADICGVGPDEILAHSLPRPEAVYLLVYDLTIEYPAEREVPAGLAPGVGDEARPRCYRFRVWHLPLVLASAARQLLCLNQRNANTATDVSWTIASQEVHHLLTSERGWSGERYEVWLAETIATLLLPSEAPSSSESEHSF